MNNLTQPDYYKLEKAFWGTQAGNLLPLYAQIVRQNAKYFITMDL